MESKRDCDSYLQARRGRTKVWRACYPFFLPPSMPDEANQPSATEFTAAELESLAVVLASVAVMNPAYLEARLESASRCMQFLGVDRSAAYELCEAAAKRLLFGTGDANSYRDALLGLSCLSDEARQFVIRSLQEVATIYEEDRGSEALVVVAQGCLISQDAADSDDRVGREEG